ncbi:MAG TPA: FAD:protein FMN transferase [Acidimicrobiales bacterium]|nr:FAD:protein FMN transferase [Acidimicrobiales bacterium]
MSSLSFPALGTTASLLVTDPSRTDLALRVLRSELEAIDLAASRFRPDSELVGLNANAGRVCRVTAVLYEAIEAAIRAAEITDGLVDPTVGQSLQLAGYDRDFESIDPYGPPLQLIAHPVPGWRSISLKRSDRSVRMPKGVSIDLGATAKALCADRAARRAAYAANAGVLVNLGGDIATAGQAPPGGWNIRITHDHADPPGSAPGPVVAIKDGGLSTSSTSVRRWIRGGVSLHHIIDPATGLPARERWRTVTVAAGTCLDANIASCASIVLGDRAPRWLAQRAMTSRLVDPSGRVTVVAGWPDDASSPRSGAAPSC